MQVLTGIAECGFLVEVESLLSSIGNENGMIMDKVYATRSLKNVQVVLGLYYYCYYCYYCVVKG